MLHFDENPRRRFDVRAMNLAIMSFVHDLTAFLREEVFPLPVPVCFIFPPRIAALTPGVGPVMPDSRTALRYSFRAADITCAPEPSTGLYFLTVYDRVLQSFGPRALAKSSSKRARSSLSFTVSIMAMRSGPHRSVRSRTRFVSSAARFTCAI